MKILAIGNSFSQDALRYLHQIAKADCMDMKVINLYIGGCSLKTHYLNAIENISAYSFEFNGISTGIKVSIKQVVMSDEWDYVTLQQVSNQSPYYDTYQPYLNYLADYVKKYCPKAKILIHQTWAYEDGSERLCSVMGYGKSSDMFADVEKVYKKASKDIDAVGIIPSGKAFQTALEQGIKKIHRDTFHASLGVGRYILGLVWYRYLTGNSVINNTFSDLDEAADENEIKIAKKIAEEVC